MTYNIPNDGGIVQSHAIIKFMAILMVVFCGFIDCAIGFHHFWSTPISYVDDLIYVALFIAWPFAAFMWVSWALFSKVVHSTSGMEIYSAWGRKTVLKWSSVSSVHFYHRFGARRFAFGDEQSKLYYIEMDSTNFSDFLFYAQEHLLPSVEAAYRFTFEAARETMRASA
jgi:hypothetical protein